MSFSLLNSLGKERTPFLFLSDFKAENIEVYPLETLHKHDIEFCIDENYSLQPHKEVLKKGTLDFQEYRKKFDKVIEKIEAGETYLLNLTQETPIESSLSLSEIYALANAPYKLRYKDEFVCFSPEKFIEISENTIHTFPMKGTIDASLKDAKRKILADEKEMAEHVMIVDLLRNDLSIVAENVHVKKFRYVQKIDSGAKSLLQVSSHICGSLQENWQDKIGSILEALLPAGSISGTPKKSTLKIIDEVEGYNRGYFSGVFGCFDGENFKSGVMIRFIEKGTNGLYYKSGGGITLDSRVALEYNELQDKIYLP